MTESPTATITEHFSDLKDPRIDRSKLHRLTDIVTIAICAVICGADTWVDVEVFGNEKIDWLRKFLELPNGIASHDTFGDVFARLDPEQFQSCFMSWVQAVSEVTKGQVVAVDGKTIRRSHDGGDGKPAIDMVNVWASANRMVLGQRDVDAHTNEITAIPLLLEMLDHNQTLSAWITSETVRNGKGFIVWSRSQPSDRLMIRHLSNLATTSQA